MITVLQKIFRFIATSIVDIFLALVTNPKEQKTVLVVNLATIGDYILFRNFLQYVKEEYNEHRVVLCGNIIWRELSEHFDNPYVDEFIWVDVHKFVVKLLYRFSILKRVRIYSYDVALHPCYSRSFFLGDQIIKNVMAKEKIGSKCEKSAFYFFKRLTSDRYYTKLINTPDENIFEFDRYKIFFENVVQAKLPVNKPRLPLLLIKNPVEEKRYAVIVPGAGAKFRQWRPENFAEIIRFLWKELSLISVLIGSKDEVMIGERVLHHCKANNVINMMGKLSLLESTRIIQDSVVVISNDTGMAHVAVALNKNLLCISNGNHFGRFAPYPSEIYDKAYYFFPPEIATDYSKHENVKEKYRYNSNLDINSISPDIVKTKIAAILSS